MEDRVEEVVFQKPPQEIVFTITPSHLYQYEIDPLWIWYDQFGDRSKKEPTSDFSKRLIENGALERKNCLQSLEIGLTEVAEKDAEEAFKKTLELMAKGVSYIYRGCLQFEKEGILYRGRPDLLEKQVGASYFGPWFYSPIEIKSTNLLKTIHKTQLAFHAMLLNEIQGVLPENLALINRKVELIPYHIGSTDINGLNQLVEKIVTIVKGKKPPFVITSKTKTSPWFNESLREAIEANDISLIHKLPPKSVEALRENGIFTLQDLSKADLTMLPKIPNADLKTLNRAKLQAYSLLENVVVQLHNLENLPENKLILYFDIEGNPFQDLDYLFGFWVSGDPNLKYAFGNDIRYYPEEEKYYIYFFAENEKEEKKIWEDFLLWLSFLPDDYSVVHYGNYEKLHLRKFVRRYGTSPLLQNFQKKLLDLHKVIEKSFIFPLYFYSLKDIAKSPFINFTWRNQKASGSQSILWYEQWMKTPSSENLNELINYNEDDVRATEKVFQFIINLKNEDLLKNYPIYVKKKNKSISDNE